MIEQSKSLRFVESEVKIANAPAAGGKLTFPSLVGPEPLLRVDMSPLSAPELQSSNSSRRVVLAQDFLGRAVLLNFEDLQSPTLRMVAFPERQYRRTYFLESGHLISVSRSGEVDAFLSEGSSHTYSPGFRFLEDAVYGCLAVLADDRFAVATASGEIRVLSVKDGSCSVVNSFDTRTPVKLMASLGSRGLVTVGGKGEVTVWDDTLNGRESFALQIPNVINSTSIETFGAEYFVHTGFGSSNVVVGRRKPDASWSYECLPDAEEFSRYACWCSNKTICLGYHGPMIFLAQRDGKGWKVLPPLQAADSVIRLCIDGHGGFATGGFHGVVESWRIKDGQWRSTQLGKHQSHITGLTYVDGLGIVSVDFSKLLCVWNIQEDT